MVEENFKYTEIAPSLVSVRILLEHFKKEKVCLALYFLADKAGRPQVNFSINGKTSRVRPTPAELNDFPSRESFSRKIAIRNINRIPKFIRKKLKPQMGLISQGDSPGESVLVIQLQNQGDLQWDYLYLLIDQHLMQMVDSRIKTSGFITENEKNKIARVKAYFNMMFPLLENFTEIEKEKLGYTKDLISTLERSIVYNQQLQSEVALLKERKDNSMMEAIQKLAVEEAGKFGHEIEISQNTVRYIRAYKGSLEKLKDAFLKAIRIASYIASNKNENKLVIEPELIQVNEGPRELSNSRLNPNRVEKAENLLQRYEDAAQRVQNLNNKITINTIARYVLPKSISAPAVSDSLKKYRTEIIYLLDTKKSNWILLRTYFGPISSMVKKGYKPAARVM